MDASGMADFIAHHHRAVLATSNARGQPQARPVAFSYVKGAFWVASVAGRRLHNLQVLPFGSLVVSEGERGRHRVLIADGPVRLHSPEAVRQALEADWSARHGSWPEWATVFLELSPDRVFSFQT